MSIGYRLKKVLYLLWQHFAAGSYTLSGKGSHEQLYCISVSNLPRVGKSKILIFVKFNIFAKWHKARILEHVNGGTAKKGLDS